MSRQREGGDLRYLTSSDHRRFLRFDTKQPSSTEINYTKTMSVMLSILSCSMETNPSGLACRNRTARPTKSYQTSYPRYGIGRSATRHSHWKESLEARISSVDADRWEHRARLDEGQPQNRIGTRRGKRNPPSSRCQQRFKCTSSFSFQRPWIPYLAINSSRISRCVSSMVLNGFFPAAVSAVAKKPSNRNVQCPIGQKIAIQRSNVRKSRCQVQFPPLGDGTTNRRSTPVSIRDFHPKRVESTI